VGIFAIRVYAQILCDLLGWGVLIPLCATLMCSPQIPHEFGLNKLFLNHEFDLNFLQTMFNVGCSVFSKICDEYLIFLRYSSSIY
jgi:hypothetical protein